MILLDAQDNPLDAPFLIPQACPPSSVDPCGPYTRTYEKKSDTRLSPKQAVKYRTTSANGQSKVVPLPAPIELY
ncbi:hypothetical protein [Thermus sp. LT1-2-5]|uniref:hypothetical protein n=1 Tax=Thermus sp. LT1-2-5 TaxID=3026935 RepID=UPI0033653801